MSVCIFVCLSAFSRLKHLTYKSNYQSKMFVCNQGAYTDNSVDAVDKLLIYSCNRFDIVGLFVCLRVSVTPLHALALKFMVIGQSSPRQE